jgi:uncharacterized protein (UPF0248 family)
LGKKKQEMWLADKLGEDNNVVSGEKGRENTVTKLSGSKIKQVDRFIYMGSVVEKKSDTE